MTMTAEPTNTVSAPKAPARRSTSPGKVAGTASRAVTMIILGVLMLFPIYYMFYLAFSAPGNAFSFPPTFIPNPFAWQNVLDAPVDGTRPLWGYARNSLIYATLATAGCLIAETITGYALARLRFPGRGVIFAMTVAMMMMPFVVTMIPRFLLFKNLDMINTLWPLILPWWFGGAPYGIFLMRQFFLTVPLEVDEAARVDGAGPWRTLWLILVPQAIPVMVSLGMLHFAYFWNDLLGPIIYCQSQSCMTLPQGILFNYKSNWDPQWELFMMSALLMILPVAIIFLILQRRFKQAFLFSGLGGR
jgi:multiple sugar transport system permease protein